jgi:hypothetical protein
MELNDCIPHEPIMLLNGERCFCVEGNRLASDYLQSEDVAAVSTLKKFLSHSSRCKTCR